MDRDRETVKFVRFFFRRPAPPTIDVQDGPRGWLPIIDTDSCGGCGKCVEACEPGCIDLVWAFATLNRPEDCDSCERCADVCPHQVIRMGLVAFSPSDEEERGA